MKKFYLISIEENNDKDQKGPNNCKLFESLIKTIQKESIGDLKSISISDPEMGILLDALYGQIYQIEKDCKKLGKKIAKVC